MQKKYDFSIKRVFPKNNRRYPTCIDDIICSISTWKNKDFEFMYWGSWDFKYDRESTKGSLMNIFNAITINNNVHIYEFLSKYHKTDIKMCINNDVNQLYDLVENQVLLGIPLIIGLDGYYIEWDTLYFQKEHNAHACVVTGIDRVKRSLLISDCYFNKKDELISFDLVNQATHFFGCVTFTGEPEHTIQEVRSMLKDLFLTINYCQFDNLRTFADDIQSVAEYGEAPTSEAAQLSSIYTGLNQVILGRLRFAYMLNYIRTKYDVAELGKISDRFYHSALNWEIVLNLMIKSLYMENFKKQADKVADKIYSAAAFEENVLQECQTLFFEAESPNVLEKEDNILKDRLINIKSNYKHINLAPIANNKGFVLENSDNIQADLTGLGEYFLLNNIVNASIFESGSYIFTLPDFSRRYDNVSCTGQYVEINERGISGVHILGCSEWGNSIVNFIVEYESGYTEGIELMVTDLSCEPMYNEYTAIQGTTQRNEGGAAVTIQEPAFINVLTLATEDTAKIKRIQLPDNANYHILSISLSMRE